MVDAEENAMDIEAPDTPLFATRLSKISLRDVVMLGALLFTMANYQFNVKAQVDSVTKELALMPHWVQGLSGVLAFVIPIYKLAKKMLADQATEAGA
jgi:Na+/melibiose symporter-like transporter